MTTVYDVPPDQLIQLIAEHFKNTDDIEMPDWANYVKTGAHREKPPEQDDWWCTRAAAIFRKIYVKGPIGAQRLGAMYGGPRDRGSRPNHAVKGSRSIVRECLKQLETAGLCVKDKNRGRVVTSKGRSMLDNLASEIMADLIVEHSELSKY